MKRETDVVELLRNDSRLRGDPVVERARSEIVALRASLKEMLDCYWGEGDGEPPPQFIRAAQALASGVEYK